MIIKCHLYFNYIENRNFFIECSGLSNNLRYNDVSFNININFYSFINNKA